jgi:2-keto-4-pentenoate hydratase/2-oxohepta-3-ene-1,7-dioic acid hydratase in catechol pathway
MRIGRFSDGSAAFWAAVDSDAGRVRPLVGGVQDWGPGVAAGGGDAAPLRGDAHALGDVQILMPAESGAKVVCLGATYAKHVEGLGREMAGQPAGFWKPFTALLDPEAEIVYPSITNALDFEVELTIVVGTERVDRANPASSILGYTVGNDVSLRDLQFAGSVTGMDMFSSKSADRSSGIGPWIVTRDEFGDGHPDLLLTLNVNGEERQKERTSAMAWPVDFLLRWADERTTLSAGDVVMTGTPAGVAYEDGRYLQPGDVVEAAIEGIGTLRNTVGPRP